MKLLSNILAASAALVLLSACNDDLVPTVADTEHAIVVHAGIADDALRARPGRAFDAKQYVAFTQGTAMAVRFDGKWVGKGDANNIVRLASSGTIQPKDDETDRDLDGTADNNTLTDTRGVIFDPALHWDDFGTADPANTDGRNQGITIYGAAIDGVGSAPIVSSWTALPWTLPNDQSGTNGWKANDLLTSNNIKAGSDYDGTYRFDDLGTASISNLMKFTHAMTKVTVVLTAGKGFPGYTTSPSDAKFEAAPTVTLLGFNHTGTVNVEDKVSTPTASTPTIKMHLADGGATHTATFDALVFPGNSFANSDEILSLTADGNTYTVTATKLNNAIAAAIADATLLYPSTSASDYALKQGWNYKLQITVDKTAIKVIATIVPWNTIEADPETPEIAITDIFGQDGTAFTQSFDFFRSTSIASGYSDDAHIDYADGSYIFVDPLYWPTHDTHYHFRGVYPRVGSTTGWTPEANVRPTKGSAQNISVGNTAYATGTFPSDLALGYPRTTTETCHHGYNVAEHGICATKGIIKMNFEYMMSQVEVKLTTPASTQPNHVNIDANTTIKIVGGYTGGSVAMQDGTITPSTLADWVMLGGTYDDRLDAIVPQTLGDMKFVVTVKNDDDSYDTYECRIADIAVGGSTITKWLSGNKYVYTLNLKKTGISAIATLKDWVTVTGGTGMWF